MKQKTITEILAMQDSGLTVTEIARKLGGVKHLIEAVIPKPKRGPRRFSARSAALMMARKESGESIASIASGFCTTPATVTNTLRYYSNLL